MADEGDRGPGRHVELEIGEYVGALAVAEPDVLEADVARYRRKLEGAGLVEHLRLLVEHVHDLVERCGGGQEGAVEL